MIFLGSYSGSRQQSNSKDPEEDTEERNEHHRSLSDYINGVPLHTGGEGEEIEEESDIVPIVQRVDPLSAMSWGVQPVMKRVRERYGDQIEIYYDLAPVREFDNPETARQQWKDSTEYQSTPVDFSFWNNPPESTEPVNRAYAAAYKQDSSVAERYLRTLWIEGVTGGRNISDRRTLIELADKTGLDTARFEADFESAEIDTGSDHCELPLTIMEIIGEPIARRGYVHYADFKEQFIRQGLEEEELQELQGFVAEQGPVTTEEVMEVYELDQREATVELQALEGIRSIEIGRTLLWQVSG